MKKIVFILVLLTFKLVLAVNPFVGVWKTNQNKRILIPTNSKCYYEYENASNPNINGNGTTQFTSLDLTLPVVGDYKIKIYPESNDFRFSTSSSEDIYFLEIKNWGEISWNNDLSKMFSNRVNLTISAIDIPSFANVTNFSEMFSNCQKVDIIPNLNLWNISNANRLDGMFRNATLFNSPIGSWNTSKVTTMASMFAGAQNFNQYINDWNTSSVTNMFSMFSLAYKFNQPINNWDSSNVQRMDYMFQQARAFNQDISNWDTKNVQLMTRMFYGATNFNQNIGALNLNSIKSMSEIFDFSGMVCRNYDLTLKGWSESPNTPSVDNVNIGAQYVRYSSLGQHYRFLLTLKGYKFIGDIYDANCSELSVTENENTNFIEITPNPVLSIFNVKSKQKVKSIDLFDGSGKRVQAIPVKLNTNLYEVKNIPSGIYFLILKTDSNNTYVKKIIKK